MQKEKKKQKVQKKARQDREIKNGERRVEKRGLMRGGDMRKDDGWSN